MNHSGTISSNETWSPDDNPHHITGDISLSSGAIVTVEPGCEIYFDGWYYIYAPTGTKFNIEGEDGNEVLITSNQSAPAIGDWQRLQDLDGNSHIRYAIIEYGGKQDGSANSYAVLDGFGEITNCEIRYCGGNRMEVINNHFTSRNADYSNNEIHDCTNYPIQISGVASSYTVDITYNLLYDNTSDCIKDSSDDIDGNLNIINNTFVGDGSDDGIDFYNVDGANDAIYVRNNIFYNCNTGIDRTYGQESAWDVDYNDYYNCSTNTDGVGGDGTNSITDDPEFTNPGGDDYTIDTDSPCADAGMGSPYGAYIGYFDPTSLIESYEGSDTLTLSDNIELNVSQEKIEKSDTFTLSDQVKFGQEEQESSEGLGINDEYELTLTHKVESGDTLSLSDAFESLIYYTKNILNKIGFMGSGLKDINQKINTALRVMKDMYNIFGSIFGYRKDVDNKINILGRNISNVDNDFRMILPFQAPGDAGFQSLGKEYIKIYIGGVEQTDVDIDSVTITQSLNSAHTASFILGRAYDSASKPSIESAVTIKYHIWTLYKGYITAIIPGDNPDSIQINCQDEYWKQNRTQKYFYVGHQPQDDTELYYTNINQALSACGVNFGIGNFIPQTIAMYGVGTSDAISELVNLSGNYAWFYNVNKNSGAVSQTLWTSGQGSIINLERQTINKNIGLYHVLTHRITESVENIINRFRVKMGNKVIRRFNSTGGYKTYSGYRYLHYITNAIPGWNSSYEKLATNSDDRKGVFHHPQEENIYYDDVFTKYHLPALDSDLEEWTDEYPPVVELEMPFGFFWQPNYSVGKIDSGFTIDYDEEKLIFNERKYLFSLDDNNQMDDVRAPTIRLQLWKKQYYSETDDPTSDPEDPNDITSPLVFITNKMGDYSQTILKSLQLTGLSIQIGGWYQSGTTADGRAIYTLVPSWDDTAFAQDYANWELSKVCDKKVSGSIELTIDAMCFYNIDLRNRIMIDGILDNNLNIESITYNIGSWRAVLNLINGRTYNRTVSMPSHGE